MKFKLQTNLVELESTEPSLRYVHLDRYADSPEISTINKTLNQSKNPKLTFAISFDFAFSSSVDPVPTQT